MKDQITGEWLSLSDEQVNQLQQYFSPKWSLAFRVLCCYGMRVTELLMLQPENVRQQDGEWVLVFKRLKAGCSPTGKTKPVVSRYSIPDSIREELLAHVKQTMPGRRLFPITRQYFNDLMLAAAHRAGLDPRLCHPHAIRHGLGRRWAAMTTNLFELQALLGHRGIAVLGTYCSLANAVPTSKKFLR